LPDGKLIRVLTDRFDLSALSVAQLYKERWSATCAARNRHKPRNAAGQQ
jgi:hypothetical protein